MKAVRVGASVSAAISVDSQLYIWGSGHFGTFYTPHRVKSLTQLDIRDVQVGHSGHLIL